MSYGIDHHLVICDAVLAILADNFNWPERPVLLFEPKLTWDPSQYASKTEMDTLVLVSPFEELHEQAGRGGIGKETHRILVSLLHSVVETSQESFDAKCTQMSLLMRQIIDQLAKSTLDTDCYYKFIGRELIKFDVLSLREHRNFASQATFDYSVMS